MGGGLGGDEEALAVRYTDASAIGVQTKNLFRLGIKHLTHCGVSPTSSKRRPHVALNNTVRETVHQEPGGLWTPGTVDDGVRGLGVGCVASLVSVLPLVPLFHYLLARSLARPLLFSFFLLNFLSQLNLSFSLFRMPFRIVPFSRNLSLPPTRLSSSVSVCVCLQKAVCVCVCGHTSPSLLAVHSCH